MESSFLFLFRHQKNLQNLKPIWSIGTEEKQFLLTKVIDRPIGFVATFIFSFLSFYFLLLKKEPNQKDANKFLVSKRQQSTFDYPGLFSKKAS